jgi:hypothetical protein
MVLNDGVLYVTDAGDYQDPALGGALRVWRAAPHEAGVVIHFSAQQPTNLLERRKIAHDVATIVDRERPAHSDPTFVFPT